MSLPPVTGTSPAARPGNSFDPTNGLNRASLRSGPILAVVEGVNDIEFLRRMSCILHEDDPEIVNLAILEHEERLVFVPQGGGDLASWTYRLAPLKCPEFHLYDREAGSTTTLRLRTAERINRRAACRAFVTSKRTLENYLHPACLWEARGVEIAFDDNDDVAAVAARDAWSKAGKSLDWFELPRRARHRLRDKLKRWLNTEAVMRMSLQRLAERDPAGELISWLVAIAQLAAGQLRPR
jgi:hypothetical protein